MELPESDNQKAARELQEQLRRDMERRGATEVGKKR